MDNQVTLPLTWDYDIANRDNWTLMLGPLQLGYVFRPRRGFDAWNAIGHGEFVMVYRHKCTSLEMAKAWLEKEITARLMAKPAATELEPKVCKIISNLGVEFLQIASWTSGYAKIEVFNGKYEPAKLMFTFRLDPVQLDRLREALA